MNNAHVTISIALAINIPNNLKEIVMIKSLNQGYQLKKYMYILIGTKFSV